MNQKLSDWIIAMLQEASDLMASDELVTSPEWDDRAEAWGVKFAAYKRDAAPEDKG